jgi:hypothetical protein
VYFLSKKRLKEKCAISSLKIKNDSSLGGICGLNFLPLAQQLQSFQQPDFRIDRKGMENHERRTFRSSREVFDGGEN